MGRSYGSYIRSHNGVCTRSVVSVCVASISVAVSIRIWESVAVSISVKASSVSSSVSSSVGSSVAAICSQLAEFLAGSSRLSAAREKSLTSLQTLRNFLYLLKKLRLG